MRIAILGGTFNPIHIGHLFIAQEVIDTLDYQCILFIPDALPAHKNHDNVIDSKDRIAMIELATSGREEFIIDLCEIRRGGVSYTIDTVSYVLDQYDVDGKPGLIIGDDLVEGFEKWKEVEELVRIVDIIIAHREKKDRVNFGREHKYIENMLVPISSSAIRERIASGKSVRYLVPENVYEHINKHRLYR